MNRKLKFSVIGLLSILVACGVYIFLNQSSPSWHYQLQGYAEDFIESHQYDQNRIFIIDYSKDGTDEGAFSVDEIETLRNGGSNKVFSYLSIGEAEEVRWYFKNLSQKVLGPPNPAWPDNHIVKYWEQEWQDIIATGDDSSLFRIIKAGFDGIYLDIVDGYWNFQDKRPTAAEEMVEWIELISETAEEEDQNFQIIVQNAPCIGDRELYRHRSDDEYEELMDRFFDSIDGIALESTFFFGKEWENNDFNPQQETLRCIERFKERGKFILGVEYVRDEDKKDLALKSLKEAGILGLVTDRNLKGEFFGYPN